MKEEGGKILGVIGGMGPAASQLFYKMIIERTDATKDQDHLNMIILNHATMPDRTEAILNGTVSRVLDKLAADAEYLSDGGATCIAITCNTTHAVMDELSARSPIPIINMIRETAKHVADLLEGEDDKKVGIMATTGNIEMNLYQKACEESGLTPIVPSEKNQELVMSMIYDGIKKGNPVSFEEFESAAGELLDQGCKRIILGCTELSVIKEMFNLTDFYVDALEVLADKSLELCGK